MLQQYYLDSMRVGALHDQAQAALTAVAAALPDEEDWDHPGARWDWPAMAPALAGSLYSPWALPEDPALRAFAVQVLEELKAAGKKVRTEIQPGPGAWVTPDGRVGLASLHRLCAAHLAHADYESRRPGPRFNGYREATWTAAEATLLAVDPEAKERHNLHSSIVMRAVWDKPEDPDAHRKAAEAAQDADTYDPLKKAFFSGGKESFTYHRLYDQTQEPSQTWADTFSRWIQGATFGVYGADHFLRAHLARPAVLDQLRLPMIAAEAAGTAWLDGLAAGAQRPMVAVLEANDFVWSEWNWLDSALLLVAPSAAIPPSTNSETIPRHHGHRAGNRMVVSLPEVAATAARHDRVAVPVLSEPSVADLEHIAVALSEFPATDDHRISARQLNSAVGSLRRLGEH